MFDVNVTKMRVAPHDGVVVYFTIELGESTDDVFTPIFTISECALIAKRDGGYFWRGPGRKMMQGNEVMKDAKGYDKWFRFFQSYACEDDTGKFGRTPAAFKYEDRVRDLAIAAMRELPSESVAPPTKHSPAVQSAGSVAVIGGGDFDSVLEDGEDDLPF